MEEDEKGNEQNERQNILHKIEKNAKQNKNSPNFIS
jgi:hypothetical protein